jgi:hypothetical protein
MKLIGPNVKRSAAQKGSAFVYILIAIALLAALTTSFMRPSSQQTTAQQSFKTISNLKSQLEFIRSTIQQCVLMYPDGDRGLNGTSGLIGTSNTPYPINPSSTYLTSPDSDNLVKHVRCPGDPGGSTDHSDIFTGRSGKFLPPPPDLFEEWVYHNNVDGVFIYNSTDKTDAFLDTALQKLDDEFAECEADIIDATSGDIELTSTANAADPKCLDGSKCFRLWLVTQPSATYNGDTDGEEAAASCP